MKNCNCDTDILLEGSSQLHRYLHALDPANAPIDARNMQELLVFAKRYANQIRFYDIPGNEIKDDQTPKDQISWYEFFRRDMAVVAASIATIDLLQIKKDYDEINAALALHPTPALFSDLFDPILGMLRRIDRWYSVAIPQNPLHADLDLAITSNLKAQVHKIMGYEEGFKYVDPKQKLNLDYSKIENIDLWGIHDAVDPDTSIYSGVLEADKILSGALFVDDIFNNFYGFLSKLVANSDGYLQYALEQYPAHQPHMALFIAFLQLFQLAQEQMNGITGRLLDFYYRDVLQMQEKPAQPDHAFVVFELAKDVAEYDLAEATKLSAGKDSGGKDLFYQTENDLVVNQAKVKELKTIFIQKGPVNAPAADKTIEAIFARPVANSQDGFGAAFTDPQPKWPTFGKGAPLSTGRGAGGEVSISICDKVSIPIPDSTDAHAKIGFALASPQLVLQSGNRLISWKLDGLNEVFEETLPDPFNNIVTKKELSIIFSGEKGWFDVSKRINDAAFEDFQKYIRYGIFNTQLGSFYYMEKNTNTLHVFVSPSEKGVIPFDAKIHTGTAFQTPWPVMQVEIGPDIKMDEGKFASLKFSDLRLAVRVGSINPNRSKLTDAERQMLNGLLDSHYDGLKVLTLQNETGILATNKAFDPFTAYPAPGKNMFVGSAEMFNKPLSELAINIKKTVDTTTASFNNNAGMADGEFAMVQPKEYAVSVLQAKSFIQLSDNFGGNFYRTALTENILQTPSVGADGVFFPPNPINTKRLPILPDGTYDQHSEKGFLEITNLVSVNAGQGESFIQASQNLSHQLAIKEISVSYHSELLHLDSSIDQFFHIYPFGNIETFTTPFVVPTFQKKEFNHFGKNPNRLQLNAAKGFSQLDVEKNFLLVDAGEKLLPQFSFVNPYSQYTSAAANSAQNITGINSVLTPSSPSNNNQYSGLLQEEGMLFIGLEKLQPLQTISLLFQFAEGTAADEDSDPSAINWSYLTNNEWRPLKGEHIISDGTFGFQTTGIIKLDVPQDATDNNTILSTGLIWFCASVSTHTDRFPYLVDVVPQAVSAVFADNKNDASHFDKPLPASSISKLQTKVAEVAKVSQPFASFDGKHQEIGAEFYTRASEHLRHKSRAITPWDYEHLVLDKFPSIYLAKCIPHVDVNCLCRKTSTSSGASDKQFQVTYNSDGNIDDTTNLNLALAEVKKLNTLKVNIQVLFLNANEVPTAQRVLEQVKKAFVGAGIAAAQIITAMVPGAERLVNIGLSGYPVTKNTTCCGPQIAPGHVLMVPIANLKNRNAINPLQPKTSRRTLLEIESFLQTKTSPFVKVRARNPVYEQVLTAFRVQFYTGTDKGFYLKKLNDEIVHFLTPWAFDENAELKFGQKIYASAIINFIEERPYVDFITDFAMYVCRQECCPELPTISTPILPDVLDTIHGCADIEKLYQSSDGFEGEVIAKPSTARSILVSVAQHIIVPYEAPAYVSPCDIRKATATKNVIIHKVPTDFPKKNPDVKSVVAPPEIEPKNPSQKPKIKPAEKIVSEPEEVLKKKIAIKKEKIQNTK